MPQQFRGPESLPRTPVPPPGHGPAGPAGLPQYTYPLQLEGEYRTLMLSPSSTRTDETIDESIQSQVSNNNIEICPKVLCSNRTLFDIQK